jgi:hypothetical protein
MPFAGVSEAGVAGVILSETKDLWVQAPADSRWLPVFGF